VYWVTMAQLIAWMKDPVPASELRRSQALCARPEPPPPLPKMPEDGANLTLALRGAGHGRPVWAYHKRVWGGKGAVRRACSELSILIRSLLHVQGPHRHRWRTSRTGWWRPLLRCWALSPRPRSWRR
jgi:hypothetical protein